jgi:hypothetical protein
MKAWLPTKIAAIELNKNPQYLMVARRRKCRKYLWRVRSEISRGGKNGQTYEYAVEITTEKYSELYRQYNRLFEIVAETLPTTDRPRENRRIGWIEIARPKRLTLRDYIRVFWRWLSGCKK